MIKLLFILLLSSTCVLLSASSPRFGLKTAKGEPLELLELKTKALVEGPYAEVQYIQTYKNPLDHAVETKFHFPRTDSSIFHKFEAIFRNQTLVGKILEKQTAKRMYDWNTRRGNTVAYSERNQVAPDVMNIKVGNIPANETVEIVFSVIQPLETIINKFYELKLPVVLTERYSPASVDPSKIPNIQTVDPQGSLYKEWNIQVELKSNTPFALLSNPTHNLKPELSEQSSGSSSKIYKAVWNATIVPNKDFVVYFGPEKLEKPETILATSPQDPNNHVLLVNFLPDLNTIETKVARNLLETSSDGVLRLKQMTYGYDIEHAQAEFVFVIDRSGSMEGARIANLRKALAKFLKTIPKTSYFNIISFGSHYQLYRPKSVLNSPEALEEALEWAKTIQADMGGTEILDPLIALSNGGHRETNLPKIVMILTDGDVFNPDEVINHISANANKMRFCSVGIGAGASDYLVRNMAKAGKCRSEFVQDREDIGDKALYMVQAAVSQYITDVRFDINCFSDLNNQVYSEQAEVDLLMKDQAFNKWIYLENIPNLQSCQATLAYHNSLKGQRVTEKIDIRAYEVEEVTDFWHKVAYDAKIRELEQTIKKGGTWNQENIKSQIIELSTKYQILSDYTSFLAVLQESTVNPNEVTQEINIPNMKSADYSDDQPELEKVSQADQRSDLDEDEGEEFINAGSDIDGDYAVMNINTNIEVQNLLAVNADEFCDGCDSVHLGIDFDIDVNPNDMALDGQAYMIFGIDMLAKVDVEVDVDQRPYVLDHVDDIIVNVEVEYAQYSGGCTETNIGISVDVEADIDTDPTKDQEERKEESNEDEGEGEESKDNSKTQNIDPIQTGWDCENIDNTIIKECSGEEREKEDKINRQEKDKKEEASHPESPDLKLVNTTHHTIDANLTESANSSAQLTENSTQPLQISPISDEKESESIQQRVNMTSNNSLSDQSYLRFTGVSFIVILLSVLLF